MWVYSEEQIYEILVYFQLFIASQAWTAGREYQGSREFFEAKEPYQDWAKSVWTKITVWAKSVRAHKISYEPVKKILTVTQFSDKFDNNTKAAAAGLHHQLASADFILSMMFRKNIMTKTKQMMEDLQAEDSNIINAMTMKNATVENIKRINQNATAINWEI